MILKPGKESNSPKSYRPISLLPIIGKVLERIITERITIFLIDKKMLNKLQYGFQKNKSCVHQVLRLSEHVNKWFNTRPSGRTISVFIDAEKAFDTVWHDGLRQMLLQDGIPVILLRWISSWLSNRTCRIRVNDSYSYIVVLIAGVPQGATRQFTQSNNLHLFHKKYAHQGHP